MQAHDLPKHRTLYLMVPKTGTRSVVRALGLPEQPPRIHDCRRREWPDRLRFAFVRNPWDRLVSVWLEKIHHRDVIFRGFSRYDWSCGMSFSEFVRAVCAMPAKMMDHHFGLQAPLLRYDGEWCVDFLGRFERIDEDWRRLGQMLGWDVPLPHINKTAHGPWRDYYTTETRQLVREAFATDAQMFGYRYD